MNTRKTELKWAFIFVLVSLGWMLLERLAGLHDEHIDKHMIYTNFFAIPAIAVYVFALLDKRKTDFNGQMTYKQGFISGLIMTLFVTILSPVSQYITSTFITPDYFANASAYATETGMMTEEAAEEYFSLKNYLKQSLIAAPILGIVTTAIVAIFTKRKANS